MIVVAKSNMGQGLQHERKRENGDIWNWLCLKKEQIWNFIYRIRDLWNGDCPIEIVGPYAANACWHIVLGCSVVECSALCSRPDLERRKGH